MTPAQCRAARGLLQWNQDELGRRAAVSAVTIRNFENEKSVPQRASLEVIRRALESAGVEFTNGGQPGVRRMLQLSKPKAEGKVYRFEGIHRGKAFVLAVDRSVLDRYEAKSAPNQPAEHRLTRLPWLVLPVLWTALEKRKIPFASEMKLSASDFE